MKTIRQNVFETNSSSCHCVTILTDDEFNAIKQGKAVISEEGYGGYLEINYDTIKKLVEDEISHYLNRIEQTKARIQERTAKEADYYKNLIKTWEEQVDDLRTLDLQKYTEDCQAVLACFNDELQDALLDDQLFDYLSNQTGLDISEKHCKLIKDLFEDFDNIDTYGYGYECVNHATRNINGSIVHVLSYSGGN